MSIAVIEIRNVLQFVSTRWGKFCPHGRVDFIEKTSFGIQKRSYLGAGSEIRTYNPLITNEMPYR